MGAVTVVIADDHPTWRSGLRADLHGDFTIAGEAGTARDAIDVVKRTRPQVLLCDLHMPGGGLAVVEACRDLTAVIMLTVSEAERDVLDAVAAGALGYLTKTVEPAALRTAITAAAAGEPVFTPGLAVLVLGEFRRISNTKTPGNALTAREREVLQLVARGYTYPQVGAELYISAKTVETHVRNILAKLHLTRREELIRYAAEHRIT